MWKFKSNDHFLLDYKYIVLSTRNLTKIRENAVVLCGLPIDCGGAKAHNWNGGREIFNDLAC